MCVSLFVNINFLEWKPQQTMRSFRGVHSSVTPPASINAPHRSSLELIAALDLITVNLIV